ncbi:hypothetical protein SPLC1_S080570 [Arthrospira platensis C1]|nr:hypothetical protein SPLC1_S080570 [Arthrospira platensis C1]
MAIAFSGLLAPLTSSKAVLIPEEVTSTGSWRGGWGELLGFGNSDILVSELTDDSDKLGGLGGVATDAAGGSGWGESAGDG